MDGDADPGERFRVHVAACAGAEEDDIAQAGAGAGDLDREGGVVDDRDPRAGERRGQVGGQDAGGAERERQAGEGGEQALRDGPQRRVGVDEGGEHRLHQARPVVGGDTLAIASPRRIARPGSQSGLKARPASLNT